MAKFIPLGLDGLVEVRPRRFGDDRGFFSETWKDDWLDHLGVEGRFIQDNHSLSRSAGVVRGLHYQVGQAAQDKLVRVLRGAIFDVAVDIRRESPTFGQWDGLILSAELGNQLFVPKGFAHGFMTIEPYTEVAYKVSTPYAPDQERAIRFDDPAIGIDWPSIDAGFTLSEKDRDAPILEVAARDL